MRNFYNAYKTIHKLQIRSSAILVYYDLCRRTNKENECWPSKQTISKACHISVSTVTRSLRELEEAGMIATVYRFRSDNNRQTSNCYKVFDTPQNFTNTENTESIQTEVPKQQEFFGYPEENHPAACQKVQEEPACTEWLSDSPVNVEAEWQVNYTSHRENVAAQPMMTEQGTGKLNTESDQSSLSIQPLLYFLFSKYDTLDHVTVTPQGTIPEKKVTDNLRNKSIFSKLTKWYKERRRKKDAGWRYRPAQNE